MTRALLLSLSLLVACGGGGSKQVATVEPPKPDPIPATAGPDCKTAITAALTTATDVPDDLKAKMSVVLETRCTEDKWSDEARSCFATAQTSDEAQGCAEGKLTEPQLAAVKAGVEKEMEGSGMAKKKEAGDGAAPPKEEKKKGTTRGVTKKPKGGDPCQGGEVSSDPCQGGQ